MSQKQYRHIQSRTERGVLVLTVTEQELRDYDVCQALRKDLVQAVTTSQTKKVVLDLGAVEFFASVGFLPLLSVVRKVRDLGGRMVLCNLAAPVAEVFETTRLLIHSQSDSSPFEGAADVSAAIATLDGIG